MTVFLGKDHTPSVAFKNSQINYLKLGATTE